jgi:hypothetical protein
MRIPLLIVWGDACETGVSESRRNADSKQENNNASAMDIANLGCDNKRCGHLKTSICPHELSEFFVRCIGHSVETPNVELSGDQRREGKL